MMDPDRWSRAAMPPLTGRELRRRRMVVNVSAEQVAAAATDWTADQVRALEAEGYVNPADWARYRDALHRLGHPA